MNISKTATAEEWDDFVQRREDGSFCHLWGWRAVIRETFGHAPVYGIARLPDGSIDGVCPAFELRTRFLGRHLLSMPFLNYGGPCGSSAARSELAAWAIEHGKTNGLSSVVLRSRLPIEGSFPVSADKITVVLDLPATADEMWNRSFDAKFRNKIKRPQRDGMSTLFGAEHLGAFYEVFCRNMRDLGTPVLPLAFFQRIVAAFPERVVIGATYLGEHPVAAGFGFVWRGEFEMTWSSSLKELRASKPNMLLYWDYMRYLIDAGIKRFNFGRSTPGSGPHEFKLSWGGADEALPWIHWPPHGGATPSRVARMASATWRHLPLSVSKAFGPLLARQLPWW